MSDNMPTTTKKPVHVVIEAPMEVKWHWQRWFATDDGQIKLTKPDDADMNLKLSDLGCWKKTPSSFLLVDGSYDKPGTRIQAIKVVRQITGLNLQEARDLVNLMLQHQDQGLFTYEFRLCL